MCVVDSLTDRLVFRRVAQVNAPVRKDDSWASTGVIVAAGWQLDQHGVLGPARPRPGGLLSRQKRKVHSGHAHNARARALAAARARALADARRRSPTLALVRSPRPRASQGNPHDQSSALAMAAPVYDVFRGRRVHYEELAGSDDFANRRSFAGSRNLGNRGHRDKRDGHQCYAAWTRARPDPAFDVPGRMWYFLCPDHGVAFELRDGTRGSWHGRHVTHCTLEPHAVHAADALYSLFMGVYTRVADAAARREAFEAAMRAKHAATSLCLYVPLEEGEAVWVRFRPSGAAAHEWIRATGTIESERPDGSMTIRWDGRYGPSGRDATTEYTAQQMHNLAVRAGAVATVHPDMGEEQLVGWRVCVWWPHYDRLFAGVVTAWEGGTHRVRYDDGETSDWSLYWPSGAAGFVIESSSE